MDAIKEAENGKKKKTRGTEKRQWQQRITFRVTDDEWLEISLAAEKAGLTVGSYVRRQTLKTPRMRAVKTPRVNAALLAKLLGQVGRVGGNIHQIVKWMNYGEGIDQPALSSALKDFKDVSAAIMKAMGREPS